MKKQERGTKRFCEIQKRSSVRFLLSRGTEEEIQSVPKRPTAMTGRKKVEEDE